MSNVHRTNVNLHRKAKALHSESPINQSEWAKIVRVNIIAYGKHNLNLWKCPDGFKDGAVEPNFDLNEKSSFLAQRNVKTAYRYVNSALADWHGSTLCLIKAKKEVANQ
jgi:hypothetical protein